jgi:hypothetical protein
MKEEVFLVFNYIWKTNKKYHTFKTVPNFSWKILETKTKPIHLIHIYMTFHISGLVQALKYNVSGLS